MNPVFQQQKMLFYESKGGALHWLNVDDMYYAADGSRMEPGQYGNFYEPPANSYERLTYVIRYHEEKLKRLRREFDALKGHLESACHAVMKSDHPLPDESGLEELRNKQLDVQKWAKALEGYKSELEKTPEVQEQARRKEERAQRHAAADAFLQRVRGIKA